MHEGVVFSGANFVPQGNNLSNQIREKDKGKSSWQTTNFQGDSEAIRQTMCFRKTYVLCRVVPLLFAQPGFLSVV